MSDALLIAKWCWPDSPWKPSIDHSRPHTVAWFDSEDDEEVSWCEEDLSDVRAAELVVILRGHGRAYGTTLASSLRAPGNVYGETWGINGDQASEIATASLPARVRALVATIRAAQKDTK